MTDAGEKVLEHELFIPDDARDGTPTFYVNGIKIGTLRPAYFDATIRYALRKAGVTS